MRSPYSSPRLRRAARPFGDLTNVFSGVQLAAVAGSSSSLERERMAVRGAERERQESLQETPSRRRRRIPAQREQENRAGSPTPGSRVRSSSVDFLQH